MSVVRNRTHAGLIMLDPGIGSLIVAGFVVLFASAAFHKLRDLRQFEAAFAAYRLLRLPLRSPVSRILPCLECLVAAGLLVPDLRGYAGALAVGLLAVYAAAIGINLRRGRRDLACGCGGSGEERPIAWWMVWRNGVLALLLAIAMAPWGARALLPIDWLTIGLALTTLVLCYLSLDRLLGARSREIAFGTDAGVGPRTALT
jgi:hypothetical protein